MQYFDCDCLIFIDISCEFSMFIKEDIGCFRSGSYNFFVGFLGLIIKIIIDGQKVYFLVRLLYGFKGYGLSIFMIYVYLDIGIQVI